MDATVPSGQHQETASPLPRRPHTTLTRAGCIASDLCFANIPANVRINHADVDIGVRTKSFRPFGDCDDSIAHRQRLGTADRDLATSARMVSSRCRSQRPDVGMNEEPCLHAVRPAAIADAAADPGRCVFARLYGRERDLGRNASQETELDATQSHRHRPIDWLGTTHRVTTALGGTTSQRRPRRRLARRGRRHHRRRERQVAELVREERTPGL